MRTRFTTGMVVLVLLLSLSAGLANAQLDDKEKFKLRYETADPNTPFDRHDLSGIWTMTKLDHTMGTPPPALTPAGAEAIKGRVGDTTGVPRPMVAAATTAGAIRISDGRSLKANGPWLECNPMGFPRLLNDDEPMEFVSLNNRVLQFFQWEHTFRELWIDGREVPSGENLKKLGPAWYGHTAGKWDGDTLVLNTVGLDERAWLDQLGHPKSFQARIEERYRRVDANTLELKLTLYDPKYYTAPWVSDTKIFKRVSEKFMTFSGWYGLYAGITEGACAPVNEVEGYEKGFHAPAAAK
jgi:hypothetical protein